MAGLLWAVQPAAEVALVAATAKTVLRIIPAATVGVEIVTIGITFDGILPTGEPVVVEVLGYDTTTGGTKTDITTTYSSTNGQIAKLNDVSWAVQLAAAYAFTVEPTVVNKLYKRWEIHPQAGIEILLPLKQEIIVPPSGRIGLRCTAPAAVNCHPRMEGWE